MTSPQAEKVIKTTSNVPLSRKWEPRWSAQLTSHQRSCGRFGRFGRPNSSLGFTEDQVRFQLTHSLVSSNDLFTVVALAPPALFFGKIFVTPSGAFPGMMKSTFDTSMVVHVLVMLMIHPLHIMLSNRAIVTPHTLAVSEWKKNGNLLFTPEELCPPPSSFLTKLSRFTPLATLSKIPFTHLLNPMAPTHLIPYILSFFLALATQYLATKLNPVENMLDAVLEQSWRKLWHNVSLLLALMTAHVLLCAPLDVLTTRLSVQRWDGEQGSGEPEQREVEKLPVVASRQEYNLR